MDKVLVSRILFLDRDYQPCGTRVIRRPGITVHNNRTDSKRIMAVGMGAFDDGDFDKVPRYWVPVEGSIDNTNDLHLVFTNYNPIEDILSKHFRFISLHEVERKVERIKSLLGFKESYRPAEFIVTPHGGWIKENQTVVSLHGGADGLKFSLCDLLYSLHYGIEECSSGIDIIRKQLAERRSDMRFIMDTMYAFKSNRTISFVCVGKDSYVDYDKFSKIIFGPSYNSMVNIIHDLKKRMQELERQRSYMQLVMNHIMACTWYAK